MARCWASSATAACAVAHSRIPTTAPSAPRLRAAARPRPGSGPRDRARVPPARRRPGTSAGTRARAAVPRSPRRPGCLGTSKRSVEHRTSLLAPTTARPRIPEIAASRSTLWLSRGPQTATTSISQVDKSARGQRGRLRCAGRGRPVASRPIVIEVSRRRVPAELLVRLSSRRTLPVPRQAGARRVREPAAPRPCRPSPRAARRRARARSTSRPCPIRGVRCRGRRP